MVYNPNIPQGTDNLSTSQAQMLDNFGQLNTQFGIDHIPFNNSGVNGTGFHKKVTFSTVLAADPTPAGTQSVAYTKQITGETVPYFANSAGNGAFWFGGSGDGHISLTSGGTPSAGSLTLGNGVILKWGQFNATSTATTYVFPVAFPNECFNVVLIGASTSAISSVPDACLVGGSVTRTQFQGKVNTGTIALYFFAIGN